jgi:glycerol-3-phosphate dehydrogenase (NAD(P)+)
VATDADEEARNQRHPGADQRRAGRHRAASAGRIGDPGERAAASRLLLTQRKAPSDTAVGNTLSDMAAAQRDPKVVVLGGGSWGTTVASICARRGPTLQWVRSEETAEDINKNHRNTKYLGDEVALSPTLQATNDFSEAADCADVIVMGVPSHGFRGVLEQLAKELRPWVPVVSLVKGLEQGTNYRMSQIVDEVLPGHPAGILAGPNIAREVAEGYAAAATLAMPDQHLAANLANLFRTKRFRTYTTDDVVGVEMAGALKNVYAIAVGMGYALGIGENTRALVMARAVAEMSKLGVAMGGHRDTFAGLAGMGDLIVTCTSQRSRNRHVGEQLGQGKTVEEIIAAMNQVAEGVKAASVIMEFAEKYGIAMPIAREVDGVVNHGRTVEDAYLGLSAEKPGHEVHGAGF